jgi:hypothetical protein
MRENRISESQAGEEETPSPMNSKPGLLKMESISEKDERSAVENFSYFSKETTQLN